MGEQPKRVDSNDLVAFPNGSGRRAAGYHMGYYPITLELSPGWQELLVDLALDSDYVSLRTWLTEYKKKKEMKYNG